MLRWLVRMAAMLCSRMQKRKSRKFRAQVRQRFSRLTRTTLRGHNSAITAYRKGWHLPAGGKGYRRLRDAVELDHEGAVVDIGIVKRLERPAMLLVGDAQLVG